MICLIQLLLCAGPVLVPLLVYIIICLPYSVLSPLDFRALPIVNISLFAHERQQIKNI